jgi:hypothetical protein
VGAAAVRFAWAAGLCAGIAILAQPGWIIFRTGQEIEGLRAELGQEMAANEQVARDIAYLRTPQGSEQEARRRGWTLPGEVALSIVPPEPDPAAADPGEEARPAGRPPAIADRIRMAVDSCLAVFGGRTVQR